MFEGDFVDKCQSFLAQVDRGSAQTHQVRTPSKVNINLAYCQKRKITFKEEKLCYIYIVHIQIMEREKILLQDQRKIL